VNLTNVNTISIGFGDKNNPQFGGSGLMFIDDIRLYRQRPLLALSPDPQDGATNVIQPVILRWAPAEPTLQHDIYFGEDEQAVANAKTESPGIYRGRQPAEMTTYDPGPLEWGKTYYWRIDEVDEADPTSPWEGNVWSFTTVGEPLAEALDTPLRFTTGGGTNWFAQTTTSYYDGEAAQSGDISHDEESWMQTTVSGKGTLKFYWKVSSEYDYDFLKFYIDGSLQDQISGSVNWQQKMYTIGTSGSHTSEWRYVKDGGTDVGNDCGWVDKVEWVPIP